MSDHPSPAADAVHEHASVRTYVRVALILTLITALEVGVIYIRQLSPIVVPLLLAMSAAKFALVAMFYMHLKQDSRIFSGLFVFPLIIAAVMIGALLMLFAYLRMLHPAA